MIKKILVIGPSWVGDSVMAQPLYRRLHERHPGLELHVFAPAWTLPLLSRMPEVAKSHLNPFGHGQLRLGEVAALAKMFPNVTADFCWMWVLSPVAARRALDEMLETVPANKILGFGGDYRYVELTYAHARMARAGIAEVLAAKMARGWCTEREAVEMARLLLADNAARLFPQKGA